MWAWFCSRFLPDKREIFLPLLYVGGQALHLDMHVEKFLHRSAPLVNVL